MNFSPVSNYLSYQMIKHFPLQNEDLLSTVMLQLSEVPSVSSNSPDFLYLAQNINSTDTQKVIGSLVPDSTTANSLLSRYVVKRFCDIFFLSR